MDLAAILSRRHPDYTGSQGRSWWSLVRDCYRGTGGFRHAIDHGLTTELAVGDTVLGEGAIQGSYLRRYPRETREAFAERQRVSFYRPHLRAIVAQYQGQLWRRPPQRETSIATVEAMWRDTDGDGSAIDRWLQVGSRRAQLFGWCAAIVDRPAAPQSLATARTVARWLQPEEVVDWGFGADGALDWVRLCSASASRDPFGAEQSVSLLYTTWTREWWQQHRVVGGRVEELGGGEHPLDRVPLAVLYWTPPDEPGVLYGTSHLDGAVTASLELYQVTSEARAVERGTAFPVLVVQSRDPRALEGLSLGTHGGLVVEPEVQFPAYLSPPADLAQHYAARRRELLEEVYRAAHLDAPVPEAQGAPESGVARAYRFLPRRSILVDATEQLSVFERDLVRLVALWEGGDPAAYLAGTVVRYPSEFDPEDVDAALERVVLALERADLPVARRSARRQLALALDPDTDRAVLDRELGTLYDRESRTLLVPDPAVSGVADPTANSGR
jgi:hypothetical protein